MLGYILGAFLLLAPLPGLPLLPDGAEIRVVSPDLRAVYLFWSVQKNSLLLKAKPLPIPENARVRLIVRSGRELHAYEGRYKMRDIVLQLDNGQMSLRDVFLKVYHLRWPKNQQFFAPQQP